MVEIKILIEIRRDDIALADSFSKIISISDTLFMELEPHMELFKTLADHIQILKEVKGD